MDREIINQRLHVTLNADMCKCATEKGYMLPCVSITHHYGKKATFTKRYEDGQPKTYELTVYNRNGKTEAIYLM